MPASPLKAKKSTALYNTKNISSCKLGVYAKQDIHKAKHNDYIVFWICLYNFMLQFERVLKLTRHSTRCLLYVLIKWLSVTLQWSSFSFPLWITLKAGLSMDQKHPEKASHYWALFSHLLPQEDCHWKAFTVFRKRTI